MSIKIQLLRIAKLAKLKLSDHELENFSHDLQNVLQMVSSLDAVDCTNVVPLKSINSQNLMLRADKADGENLQKELLSNAPGKQAALAKEVHCFIVPKVIE
jgi:aspartyl-tRNA(Asn)/glutamyl-tRNA(Gln) amidotransferase subunit C